MDSDKKTDILCLPFGQRVYGVEFSYVEQICSGMQISAVPCLPPEFLGVYNYKGTIIPVLDLGNNTKAPSGARQVMPVIKYGKYMLGILCQEEPFILSGGDAIKVKAPEDACISGIWRGSDAYKYDGGLCLVIDVERSIEAMLELSR